MIHEATPPRNDVAKLVKWNTRDVQGRDVRIECIDNDSASAFAWIAFGEFQPSWIQESRSVMAMEQSLGWIKRLGLDEKAEQVGIAIATIRLFAADESRTSADTGITSSRTTEAAVVLGFLGSSDAPRADITQAVDALLDADDDALMEAAKQLCKRLSASQQRDFATAWAKQGASPANLIELANLGRISAEVFVDENVKQAIWPRLSEPQRADIESLTEDHRR